MAAFDSVVLLVRNIRLPALSGDLDLPFADLYVHVVAAESRKLRRDDVFVHGFVHIDRGNPAGRSGRKSIETLLDGQQITERIPPRKGHIAKSSIAIRYDWWLVVGGSWLAVSHTPQTTNH